MRNSGPARRHQNAREFFLAFHRRVENLIYQQPGPYLRQTAKMSRFFVTGYSSDSSSEEEDLLSVSEEELQSSSEENAFSDDSEFDDDSGFDDDDSDDSDDDSDRPKGPAYFLKKDFRKGAADDSDTDSDDEGRRVVKSAKDKLLDDMRDSVETINTAKRISNWTNILSEFDKLNRLLVKAAQQKLSTPNFYFKVLGELDEFINETTATEKESKKKMNAAYSRAFNTIKQRVKKQAKEYQPYLDLFREKPELFDSEEPLQGLTTPAADDRDQDLSAAAYAASGNRLLSPVFTVLRLIAETRGKKNIDKYDQIAVLEKLLEDNKQGAAFEVISIYQMLISIRFDASSPQAFMPVEQWKKNERDFLALLDLLESQTATYHVSELGTTTDDIDIEPAANANGVKVLFGSILSTVERLDDEFTRFLQNTDPHSTEYIERLKDENDLYKLIVRAQLYVELTIPADVRSGAEGEQLARLVLRRMDHIYYKPNQLITLNENAVWANTEMSLKSSIVPEAVGPEQVIQQLAAFLTLQKNKVHAKKALLYSIYYYAVNNNYHHARDLFLNSHAFASINSLDSSLQVQYNRALVQLGLSAFRLGAIEESHQALNEIANSQRLKELLGQGFNSKYPSQATTAEKQKLLPFHMHINLELLECAFMTSSLLIEIPALAAASSLPKDSKRKSSIKSFKSKLEFHDRQYFTGPPESIKDHLVHASRSLQKGDWAKAYDLLSSIKIWKLFSETDDLLAMLRNQLQVEGLRTYIFTYKSIYSKLSVAKLADMFELDAATVADIVEKMIEVGDIQGALDDNRAFVNFATDEPQRTKLQELAIIMNEKVGLLNEKNEKTSSNGHGRKQPPHQQQQQKEQKEQQKEHKEMLQEENNRFRYANVNSNNDEFQVIA